MASKLSHDMEPQQCIHTTDSVFCPTVSELIGSLDVGH